MAQNPTSHSNYVGIAILVSNGYEGTSGEIMFTHTDTDNMDNTFKKLGYLVYKHQNLDHEEFMKMCKQYADDEHSQYVPPSCKRLLFYFSGHGSNGFLTMRGGGHVQVESIITCFKTKIALSTTVKRIVKMFFFDACRGPQRNRGYALKTKCQEYENWMIPKEGSMLVAYASTPHHVSYEGSGGFGSLWTGYLIQVLNNSNDSDDVCHVLTKANILMREEAERKSHETNDTVEFQTAEFTSNLAEFVCFKKEAITSYVE